MTLPNYRAWVTPYRGDPYMAEVKSIHFGTGKIMVSDKYGNHSENDYVLLQGTGIKDCNDVELFVGDIIKRWGEKVGIFNIFDVGYMFNECTLMEGDFEIIGNVYE